MNPVTIRSLPRTAAAALVLLVPASAQEWQATPYGPDGASAERAPLVLALGQVGPQTVLEVSGGRPGTPAGLVLGDARGERPLPGGRTLLVAGAVRASFGRFDAAGRFALPLDEVPELLEGTVYAQGLGATDAPGTGFAFSAGLALEARPGAPVDPEPPQLPEPPLDRVLVEEIVALFDARQVEEAFALALNSPGDGLALDLAGELQVPVPNPVVPTLAVGGKVAFQAKITRGSDALGAPAYDLAIGADVAGTAGVTAGPAGAGIASGQGGEVIWRFASPAEVVRALRSMAILQATGPSLEIACQVLDQHAGALQAALDAKRAAAAALRGEVRSRLPMRRVRVVQELRQRADERREARHERVDAKVEVLEELIALVAEARVFMDQHTHGFEVRRTVSTTGSVGVGGVGNAEKSAEVEFANLGAKLEGSVERQTALRVELVPETGASFVEVRKSFTKTIAGGAAALIGASGQARRVLELRHRVQLDANGYAFGESGTTVRLALDGHLAATAGILLTTKAAVGGQVQAEIELRDLLAYGADGVAILLGDDDEKAARLLRSIPIRLTAEASYQAGIGVGLGVNLGKEYFKAGVSAAATYTDRFASIEYRGERDGAALQWLLANGPLQPQGPGVVALLNEVGGEVARAAQR